MSTAVTMAVRFAQMLVIARLLPPSEVGLYALSNLVLGFVSIFADAGVTQGIIARRETDRNVLSSLFWTSTLMALGVSVVLIGAAPWVADFYQQPRLATPLTWIASTFLAFALGQPFQALLQRELNFRAIAVAETVSSVTGAACSIVLTVMGQGVNGLVLGQIVYAVLRSVLIAVAGSAYFRPALHMAFAEAAPSVKFGLYQVGDRLLSYFNTRLDQMLIGYFAGPAALGVYSLAWSLVVDPVYRLNPIVTNVAFPAFAHKQDDRDALKRGFFGVTKALTAINAPILAGMAGAAMIFVPLALGPRWQETIPLMAILAWVGLVRSICNPTGSLVMGVGRPDLSFRWTTIQSAVQLPLYGVLLYEFGLIKATFFLACFMTLVVPAIYLFMVRRVLGPCWTMYVASFLPATAAAATMALGVALFGYLCAPLLPHGVIFTLQVVLGLGFYILVLALIRPNEARAALAFLRTRLRRGPPAAIEARMTIAPAEPLTDTMALGSPAEPVPTIAVVIPTYNRAHTILRTIDSVLAQTLQPVEIIVVDDGSRDDTLDLLRAQPYADRLQIIQRQNGGGPAARNNGIHAATAEWIAFVDSDDAWAPDKLRLQIDRLQSLGPEYGACYCGSIERLETGEEQGKSRVSAEGSIYRDCLAFNVPGSTSCIIARRSLLLEIGGFAENLPSCQDWDLWLRLAQRSKFASVPQILVTLYVGRSDRITANPKGRLRGHLYIYRRYIRPAMRSGQADPSMFYWILGNIFMQIDRPYYARRCYTLYWQRKKLSPKRAAIMFTAMSGLRRTRFFAVTGLLDRLEARFRPSPLQEALEQ